MDEFGDRTPRDLQSSSVAKADRPTFGCMPTEEQVSGELIADGQCYRASPETTAVRDPIESGHNPGGHQRCGAVLDPIDVDHSSAVSLFMPVDVDPIGDGHGAGANLASNAIPDLIDVDHIRNVCRPCPVDVEQVGDESHSVSALHSNCALVPILDQIRELWRRRQAWHTAEKRLTLQAKALCRRLCEGDKAEAQKLYSAVIGKTDHCLALFAAVVIDPLVKAAAGITTERKQVEKQLAKLAAQTPGADFVAANRGIGLLSLAGVVGEAGDLSGYSNPAKLWKRMGLAVMPDGTRQRRVSGDAALEHGYSPARRSLVWNIGDCCVKAGGHYREVYDGRKAYELERGLPKGHAHNRAKRYAEKRLLRDLWRAWRSPTPTGRDASVTSRPGLTHDGA